MKTANAIAFVALTTVSTFGVANTAHAGFGFDMNQGQAYEEDMGITTTVENTVTVDFNDQLGNTTGFTETFEDGSSATYSFEDNSGTSSVRQNEWAPANINGTVNEENPYLAIFPGDSVTISLNDTANYFGFNWGSVSQNNRIEFYNGNLLVAAFQSAGDDPEEEVEGQAELQRRWEQVAGADTDIKFWEEADAYLEFWATTEDSLFDSVIMSQLNSTGGGFESDNHSFLMSEKAYSVPEPGMVVGLVAVAGLVAKKSVKKS
ncbi:MAG: hypothetical protein SWJ54_15140 [Cyanobacteriota bacterium]|nr:hypothetical protein [Cyanobacteriota bacterium]